MTEPRLATNDIDKDVEVFKCSDFIVADDSALVCMLQSTMFEEIQPDKKKGVTIFYGLKSAVSAIAVHPKKPILAIAGEEGFVLLWDYLKKGDPLVNNYEFFTQDKDKKGVKIFTCMAFTPDGEELLIG